MIMVAEAPDLASPAAAANATIRHLNDQLRISGIGGRVVATAGIAALPHREFTVIMTAVAQFDDFTPDNDPHAEHDCATLSVAGHDVIWKVDYYDRSLTRHSPDPADPAVTTRVLTIMLAADY